MLNSIFQTIIILAMAALAIHLVRRFGDWGDDV